MSHNTLNRQEKASVFGQLLHFRDTMILVFCLALSFKDLFWDDLSGGGGNISVDFWKVIVSTPSNYKNTKFCLLVCPLSVTKNPDPLLFCCIG